MSAAAPDSALLTQLLGRLPAPLRAVVAAAAEHRLQILYTQVDREADGTPRFTEHAFRVDAAEYFYPASAVKLAAAILALERLHRIGVPGVTADAPLRIDAAGPGQVGVLDDRSSPTGRPSIGHYLHKLFVVSDNDAYNRLYEFVGPQELNEGLWRRGYAEARLTHRLSVSLTPEQNRRTNGFAFYGAPGRVVYEQPATRWDAAIVAPAPVPVGRAFVDGGVLVEAPMDFAAKNMMSLRVLQDLLKAVVFPGALPAARRFDLRPADRARLLRAMSILPRESTHPRYPEARCPDGSGKFLVYGDTRERMPDDVRVFNKVGGAYGFLVDNAYVVDRAAGVEFFLTATVYVNANGVLNDDRYDYAEVGLPFLGELGRIVLDHERGRRRARRPELSDLDAYFPARVAR